MLLSKRIALASGFCVTLLLTPSPGAWGEEKEKKLDENRLLYGRILKRKGSQRIRGLKWKTGKQVTEKLVLDDDEFRFNVYLRGTYPKDNWSFTWNSRKLKRKANGEFLIKLPLTDERTTFQFLAISPRGIVEREVIIIYVPHWKKLNEKPELEKKRHFLTPGLSFTVLEHTDSRSANFDFSQTALTLKLAYRYLLFPPKWDIGALGYVTALPITTTGDTWIRFIGFNARVGYVLPFVQPPWRIALFAGWYYNSGFAGDGRFGYTNVNGPQIYPVVQRQFQNGSSVSTYFKFSPVSNRLQLLELNSREIAFGGAYSIPLANQNPLSFTVDYADLALIELEDDDGNMATVKVKSLSFGVAYGF